MVCFMELPFIFIKYLKCLGGTSLVVQWLKICLPMQGTPGLIPGGGTKFHMLQGN